MGVCVGDLDSRQMERLRTELATHLAIHCAYPTFYDYQADTVRVRPLARATREEIERFLLSVNFTQLQRVDVTSPELRRFIERLFLRYLEINTVLRHPRMQRRMPGLRTRIPRIASELQRHFIAFVNGRASDFGMRQQTASWSNAQGSHERGPRYDPEDERHQTRVLEAALLRSANARDGFDRGPRTAAAGGGNDAPIRGRPSRVLDSIADPTIPVTAHQALPAAGPHMATGQQTGGRSSATGSVNPLTDLPTGPLPIIRGDSNRYAGPPASLRQSAHDLPEELYHLYGDVLRDMHPDESDFAPLPFGSENAASYQPVRFGPPPGARSQPSALTPDVPSQIMPQRAAASPAEQRTDGHIFWQLRYQLEAYVRRAARSYGVPVEGDDPYAVLDALRRSGFVDEADLRLAEGILALSDRVNASHDATIEDYRQALMLYLLYHRSHLNF